jgi:DNA repair protein RadC
MDPCISQSDTAAGKAHYTVTGISWRVCDMPERLRPREEMDRVGAANVSDDVLLAIILRSGVKGINVVDLARGLLKKYGSLTKLAGASVEELARIKGLGRVKAQVLKASLELGRRMNEELAPKRNCVRTPEDAARILRNDAKSLDREVFWVLLLDAKNGLRNKPNVVTKGLLDASLVHPREVFIEAIKTGAAAVVLVHNHPSGDETPSAEDIRITKQLVEAGRIVGIKVLDHVILGKAQVEGEKDYFSVRESGTVNFD